MRNPISHPHTITALMESSQLITVDEAIQLLKVSRTKIYHLMNSGRLVSVKIDTARRIKLASALAFIEGAIEEPHGA